MKLHGNVEILSLYMDGQLDRELQSLLESHLAVCPDCREIVSRMRETRKLLAGAAPVKPPETLERDIIAGLPEKKIFPLSLKRTYLPAIGTLAILIVTSLLVYENLNKGQEFQVARTPAHEERATEKGLNESLEGRKQPEHKPDLSAVGKDKESAASSGTAKPAVPEGRLMVLSDRPQENEKSDADILPKKERAEEKTLVVTEPAAKAPAAVMKSSAGETMRLGCARPMPDAIVIRNADEWKKIWYKQNTAQNLSLPLPEVDFKQKMVVAIPSRIEGKEYAVVNTIEDKDKIVVEYKELPLQKLAPPPYQLNVVNQKPAVELQKVD